MVAERYQLFLQRETGGVKHSGRDFYEHLKGTHDLLRDWGNDEEVCLAGLFHSVYGTEFFKHKAIALTRRVEVQELIGERAENLAYRFCTEPREKMTDRELLEIEAANLIEQSAQPTLLPQWKRLWRHRDKLSAGARLALGVS